MTALRSPWTRVVIDPIAVPLSRRLALVRGVTPNRVTAVSVALGIGSAGCFATGRLGWGGALFLLRYLADCVDGMVARRQGTGSTRGAVFDIAADVCGIHLAFAALAWHLVGTGHLSATAGVALLGAIGTYNWALAHRKHLAERAGAGDGGSAHTWTSRHRLVDAALRRCRALGMTPVPWAVEAETLALGLAPFLGPGAAAAALHVALAFYVVATTVNLRRLWHLATVLDTARPAPPASRPTATPEETTMTADPTTSPTSSPTTIPDQLPRVDVVIATRNRPELLRGALGAVLAQTYAGPIQVHVVFDQCPVDASVAVADPHRGVTVHRNHHRPGLAGARNTGIEAGTGVLVAFCDDDDAWLPTKLAQQTALLIDSGAATAVTGIVVEYADRAVPRVPRPEHLAVRELARRRVMEAHMSTVLVRRSALPAIGPVDEEIPGSYGEDYDWILRAAAQAPIAVLEEAVVRVRWGQSQFSRDWATIIAAIDHGIARNPAFSADPRALARLRGRRAFALAALGSPDALPAALLTLRTSLRERRAYLAAAVALHLVSAERLMDLAHRRGHGI